MRLKNLLALAALLMLLPTLLFTAPARAVTVDLGVVSTPPPTIPDLTVVEGSPYYITNTAQVQPADPADPGGVVPDPIAAPATADVVDFRVGAGVAAHVGYGPAAIADESIAITVQQNLSVAGNLNLGSAETTKAITMNVAGNMTIDGGRMAANGGTAAAADPADPAAPAPTPAAGGVTIAVTGDASIANGSLSLASSTDTAPAALTANRILVGTGGSLTLSGVATATTTGVAPAPPAGGVAEPYYAAVVANGGVLTLDGGVEPPAAAPDPAVPPDPAAPADPAWVFRGIDVSAGGDGVLVESGGVLAAGAAGGTIKGLAWPAQADPTVPATGQRLLVRKGGSLDASRGVIRVQDLGGVAIEGAYTAGYSATNGITRLEADASRVDIAATAEIGMSRDLQRHINSLALPPGADTAGILRGGEIVFASGTLPTLKTGLGAYSMKTATNADGIDILYVGTAENRVEGSGLAHDRAQFQNNMNSLWQAGGLNASQADVIYDLAALPVPAVSVSPDAQREGAANKQALEALVSGPGAAVGERGIADAGLYELYTGAAQWGTNAVAYGAAAEVLSNMRQRVDFLEEELLRTDPGVGYAGGAGYASYAVPEAYANRVWAGGFGRNEEAELDYGIAGYEYKQSGVIAGYDKIYGDSLVVGGAVAMGDGDFTDFAATSGNSEITSYSVGGYVALRRWTGFSATGYGSYSLLKNDLDDVRGGLRRRAEYDSAAWTLGGRLGYDLYPAMGLKVTPSVGLERIHAVSREHSEIIDDLSLIRVGDMTRDSTLLPFEVAATFDLLRWESALLRLNTTLGYAYDLSSGGMEGDMTYQGLVGAGPVAAADREMGRNRFNFGAGLQFSGTKLDVDARYNYYTRDNYKAHLFQGNLGVKF